jgi:prephenate dehydrogenase
MKPIITIIGAHGKMGSAFTQLFKKHELTVLEVDLNTDLKAKEVIPKADIVIFSVPISSTVQLIQSLGPLIKSGALIADLTSIKTPALATMLASAPTDTEILGMHPMFGPSGVEEMTRQVIAVCKKRSGPWSEFLIRFFGEQGAIIKETTPEEHDKMMSIIQGLTHLSSIATAMALKQLGFGVQESFEFSSPIYRLRLEMVGRILSQDPKLYADIAIENPLTMDSLTAYQQAIEHLSSLVKNHDTAGFVSEFQQAAAFLGDFKDDAYQRTNELIKRCKDIL